MPAIVIVGRTPSKFAKWLEKHGLRVPDPEWLGEMTAEWVLAVEKGERDKAEKVFEGIVKATGVMELKPSLRREVEEQVLSLLMTHYLLALVLRTASEKTPPEADGVMA